MKSRTWHFAAIALITLLVIPSSLAAQDHRAATPRYILKKLGVLGGYSGWLFTGPPSFKVLNNRGMVVEAAGLTAIDPYSPCFTDCLVDHAARWQNGVLTDLGALPGNNPKQCSAFH
jgi:hypothetical protein